MTISIAFDRFLRGLPGYEPLPHAQRIGRFIRVGRIGRRWVDIRDPWGCVSPAMVARDAVYVVRDAFIIEPCAPLCLVERLFVNRIASAP